MAQFLDSLPDGGLVMCHPGFVDDVLVSLDPLTTQREHEHAYLAGERFPGPFGREQSYIGMITVKNHARRFVAYRNLIWRRHYSRPIAAPHLPRASRTLRRTP